MTKISSKLLFWINFIPSFVLQAYQKTSQFNHSKSKDSTTSAASTSASTSDTSNNNPSNELSSKDGQTGTTKLSPDNVSGEQDRDDLSFVFVLKRIGPEPCFVTISHSGIFLKDLAQCLRLK